MRRADEALNAMSPPDGSGTRLQLLLGNMHDTAVRGHMDFHWDMTLPVLKRYCEATRVRRA